MRVVAALLSVLLLSGCGMLRSKKPADASVAPPTYDQLMEQAEARMSALDVNGAKALFSQAADADPVRKEPWYQLAQINFGQRSYGKAIVDAQEVLQRDSTDMKAENILTVAGLRVAADALGRLHDEADLRGPAHVEAEKLAEKMRQTLGQDVLVPQSTDTGSSASSRKRAAQRRVSRPVEHERSAPSAPAKPQPVAPSSSNPFQSLPGG